MIQFNEDAKKRQNELKELGFYSGEIDGLFGAKSKRAEREYLKSIGKLSTPKDIKQYGLSEHRREFSRDFAKLILHGVKIGFEVAIDDVKSLRRCKVHMRGSQHEKALAGDLLLFIDGEYLRKTNDHKPLGKFWEDLSPYNRWGGRYSDGNHYERLEYLWREQ